jgi:hypothetical protein
MRGDMVADRLTAWIRASGLTLTVHYPAPRAVVPTTGPVTTPVVAPVSPLTGPKPVQTVFPAAVTPAKPAVTLSCLWLDTTVLGPKDMTRVTRLGWVEGATALARVLVADAALDAAVPTGHTVFTGAEVVEFHGMRYRVLAVEPVGASFRAPLTYHVWLTGGGQ